MMLFSIKEKEFPPWEIEKRPHVENKNVMIVTNRSKEDDQNPKRALFLLHMEIDRPSNKGVSSSVPTSTENTIRPRKILPYSEP